jgi:hypothetical protein
MWGTLTDAASYPHPPPHHCRTAAAACMTPTCSHPPSHLSPWAGPYDSRPREGGLGGTHPSCLPMGCRMHTRRRCPRRPSRPSIQCGADTTARRGSSICFATHTVFLASALRPALARYASNSPSSMLVPSGHECVLRLHACGTCHSDTANK